MASNAQLAAPPKGLVKKLCEAGAELGWIEKSGRNNFHNYNYATEADLVAALRGKLYSRNVFIFPNVVSSVRNQITVSSVKNGQTHERQTALTDVQVEWTFVDGDTGETWACQVPGCGEDSGDKGVYKAMTGSEKYMLMKAFLIPTGDDPEEDTPIEKREAYQNGKEAAANVAKQKVAELSAGRPQMLQIAVEPIGGGISKITGNGLASLLTGLDTKDPHFKKTCMNYDDAQGAWHVVTNKAYILGSLCADLGLDARQIPQSQPVAPTQGYQASDDDLPANMSGKEAPKPLSGFRTYGKRFTFYWGETQVSCFDSGKIQEAIKEGCRTGSAAVLVLAEVEKDGKKYSNLKAILKIGERDYTQDQTV